jgi:hypothetical protein
MSAVHSFYVSPWEFGWEALVALATFTLAAVTVVLAWRTSNMASETADLAKSTKEDVALSRTAIEGDVRPVLIAVPHGEFVHPTGRNYDIQIPGGGVRGHPDRAVVYVQDVDGRLFVSVPARNEGAGIAFVRSGVLDWQGAELPGVITSGQVPPRAFTRASFGLPAPSLHAVNEAGSLSVRITYTDLAGNIWASKFTLEPAPEIGAHDWKVGGFELSHQGRTEAVTSGTA